MNAYDLMLLMAKQYLAVDTFELGWLSYNDENFVPIHKVFLPVFQQFKGMVTTLYQLF